MSTEINVPAPKGKPKAAAITYKILIIGDSSVGKTSLLNRYCDNNFHGSLISTVGIDYKTKLINLESENEAVKLQIWDTAGHERFRTLTNAYFRGACGAVLLYDITCRESFSNVAGWMESVEEHGSTILATAIVGHKADLTEERIVTVDEGKKLAENYDCLFFEASAKTGFNCDKIFSRLAARIKDLKDSAASNVYQQPSGQLVSSGINLDNSGSNNRQSSCC